MIKYSLIVIKFHTAHHHRSLAGQGDQQLRHLQSTAPLRPSWPAYSQTRKTQHPAHLFHAHIMWCAREKDAGKTAFKLVTFIDINNKAVLIL
jgi:hypothetical protein